MTIFFLQQVCIETQASCFSKEQPRPRVESLQHHYDREMNASSGFLLLLILWSPTFGLKTSRSLSGEHVKVQSSVTLSIERIQIESHVS